MHSGKAPFKEVLFLLVFAGTYALLHFLYFIIPYDLLRTVVYYYGIVVVGADVIHWIAPGEAVTATHNVLSSSKASLEIVRGCDGSGVVFLMVSAILAFSDSIRRKLLGVLGAIVLMYFLNLARIVGLYFVVAYRNDWFVTLHTYFVPTFVIIVSCIYFAFWALGSAKRSNVPARSD